MTNQETIANLNMISVAFVEPVTKEQRKLIDDTFDNAIKALEQEPKTGHWIKQTLSVKPFGEDTVLCDQCAFMTDKDNNYNYCPNCGAKMESEEV